ncbi:UMP-CMP kinase 2 [Chelonus insularis]|uniref:UMP-CMP kinase 2 n=1 Tax=Chelonus insularis TaxID=460826 RepID=UPI00158936DC|nr:UMP-CMP kinase 2 [Chelonus insularis]
MRNVGQYTFYFSQSFISIRINQQSHSLSNNHGHLMQNNKFLTNWIFLLSSVYKKFDGLRRLSVTIMQKPEVLFILGGPGSGKGTLCYHLVKKTGYVHLSAGDLLREERARPGSEFGEMIETHIRNGHIVPVEVTCSLLDRAMQMSSNPQKRFLIDGFPRNQDNLDGWTKTMTDKAIVKGVIFLECSQEVCTQRCINRGLKGSGRSDDNPESLIKRHETFINQTMPIIKYYEERGLLYKFNSMKPPKAVVADVCKKLEEIGLIDEDKM